MDKVQENNEFQIKDNKSNKEYTLNYNNKIQYNLN